MPGPVDWNRAERIAIAVARRQPGGGDAETLGSTDFAAVARLAEDRVEAETGLRSLLGDAEIRVVDRAGWIRANIASFRTLLEPVLTKWVGGSKPGRSWTGVPRAVSAQVAGAEVGVMLGWMSARVLGQYDVLLGSAHGASGDGAVYLVGPNMATLERRFGFDPEEFRLWVTLHELTHRAQFTGVPWMRDHFLGLVHETLKLADPDPGRMLEAMRDAMRDRDAAKQRLRDGGLVAMVSTPAQQAVFHSVAGLMSLLEGHGDVVMDRAGGDLVPSAQRFSQVLAERRQRANPMAKVVQRLIGLEGKLNQYAAGEQFIAAIEAAGGERAIDHCWTSAENLPSLPEVRAPGLWLERMGIEPALSA
ncbi:MAG: coenzyme biosynthesis-associated protein [Ilumatobacteraceae bacterium]|nr:coenzyme biosynthesis-associated protein [Ilumatobacteraceae bacterium]